MQDAVQCRSAEKNSELQTKPFEIFLSVGAVVGKNSNDRVLKKSSEISKSKSYWSMCSLTASTGKAAIDVNEIMLHSAFHL